VARINVAHCLLISSRRYFSYIATFSVLLIFRFRNCVPVIVSRGTLSENGDKSEEIEDNNYKLGALFAYMFSFVTVVVVIVNLLLLILCII